MPIEEFMPREPPPPPEPVVAKPLPEKKGMLARFTKAHAAAPSRVWHARRANPCSGCPSTTHGRHTRMELGRDGLARRALLALSAARAPLTRRAACDCASGCAPPPARYPHQSARRGLALVAAAARSPVAGRASRSALHGTPRRR